ncbi:MAG: ABC transporter substrate-binding protein [Hyphomicrobiales bacterium]|nr:MAG: ABC transporter substrate-binding protein [Hyphomicrobiales bacterium]
MNVLNHRILRIGTGAGFSGDRIEPAVELCEKGDIDYLVFECLAERTIALAQLEKLSNPNGGYDKLLEQRMVAVLPICYKKNIKIITNMGAANPLAASKKVQEVARSLGIHGLKIATIMGDDVADKIDKKNCLLDTTQASISDLGDKFISANAYIGVESIVDALAQNADVIITGRASDPSMFLAPQIYEFGWAMDDWVKLGRGTIIGHMLECAGQVTGGYFSDPGQKEVPNLAELGFPLAEIDFEGNAVITKVEGSGGIVSEATCKEQLLYEIHDPKSYLQPDVIADFSNVIIERVGENRVAITGGSGYARTDKLKVSIGYDDSWVGEGQISYAGLGCVERGKQAIKIIEKRISLTEINCTETRGDLIGMNAILGEHGNNFANPYEIRVRFAARCPDKFNAERICQEVESLYLNGPSGGGGVVTSFKKIIAVASTLIPKQLVDTNVKILES